MELLELGDLWRNHQEKPFSVWEVVHVLQQSLSALNCIHDRGITHRCVLVLSNLFRNELTSPGISSLRISSSRVDSTYRSNYLTSGWPKRLSSARHIAELEITSLQRYTVVPDTRNPVISGALESRSCGYLTDSRADRIRFHQSDGATKSRTLVTKQLLSLKAGVSTSQTLWRSSF